MADGTNGNPRFARAFAGAVGTMDGRGAAEHRRRLVSTARGTVVEIGAGTGANFTHYPDAVERVVAIEPEPELRALSLASARKAPVAVTVIDGVAESLPLPDDSADTVVTSLVLCSVTDQRAAIAECLRVLRPGGALLFYEHVRSSSRVLAAVEDLVTPVWSRLAGGCHPNRDTVGALRAGGFEIVRVDRFGFAPLPLNPRLAHVLGSARPATPADRRR